MTVDLDTFLVALYTIVDDLYQEHFAPLKPQRPGKRPYILEEGGKMRAGVADRFVLGQQDRSSEWSSRLPSSPRARTVTWTRKSVSVRLGLPGSVTS